MQVRRRDIKVHRAAAALIIAVVLIGTVASNQAVAGWYLMESPDRPGAIIEPDLSVPLARWEIMGSDDTANQCMDVKVHVFDQDRLPDGSPDRPSRAAKCIATDDPRLKEK
jgi:hypothetical protein